MAVSLARADTAGAQIPLGYFVLLGFWGKKTTTGAPGRSTSRLQYPHPFLPSLWYTPLDRSAEALPRRLWNNHALASPCVSNLMSGYFEHIVKQVVQV